MRLAQDASWHMQTIRLYRASHWYGGVAQLVRAQDS